MWMEFIFTLICILGVTISIDEMTANFKGNNADQIRMKYTAEGDGLQEDAIFQKGYTFQSFMCTDPDLKTYLSKILSPLHDVLMALFDTVEGKNHQCTMDNIYNSAAFFKVA